MSTTSFDVVPVSATTRPVTEWAVKSLLRRLQVWQVFRRHKKYQTQSWSLRGLAFLVLPVTWNVLPLLCSGNTIELVPLPRIKLEPAFSCYSFYRSFSHSFSETLNYRSSSVVVLFLSYLVITLIIPTIGTFLLNLIGQFRGSAHVQAMMKPTLLYCV